MKKLELNADLVGPLKDLNVLDISRLLAGNFLSFHLAEMGAEVLKVEDTRRWDPLRDFTSDKVDVTWKVLCRNKKSLVLNYSTSEKGRDIFLKLVRKADVMIENFKPGGLEKMGLSPEFLLEINPALVIVRISGWGQDGPYSHKPGFGTLVEAASGFAAKTGFPDSGPLLPNMGLADMITGVTGAFSVLCAIRNVEVSGGEGQVIDLSLFDSIVSFLGDDPGVCQCTEKPIPRLGNRSEIAAPRNLYLSDDGRYIALSASMQSMAERLFKAIGRPEMTHDPRFRTNEDRVRNAEELDRIIGNFIGQRSYRENLEFFEKNGITAGPLYDAVDILEDPHVKERGVYVEMDDPEVGTLPVPNVAARLSRTPGGVRRYAPGYGEHTAEVLASLGISADDLEELISEGAIRCSN